MVTKCGGGLMLDAYLSWERGEWKEFMERTKTRYEEIEINGARISRNFRD